MTKPECTSLLLCCGALHDISERKEDLHGGEQIKEVLPVIEKIAEKYLGRQKKRKRK